MHSYFQLTNRNQAVLYQPARDALLIFQTCKLPIWTFIIAASFFLIFFFKSFFNCDLVLITFGHFVFAISVEIQKTLNQFIVT